MKQPCERFGIYAAICTVTALVCGVSAGLQQQPIVSTTGGSAVAAARTTIEYGACHEVIIDPHQRGDLPPQQTISEWKPKKVVALHDVGNGAYIDITGNGSCLYITGGVDAGAIIRVSGSESSVVIDGSIERTATVEAHGDNATMFLPSYRVGVNEATISVDQSAGGAIWIHGGVRLGQ